MCADVPNQHIFLPRYDFLIFNSLNGRRLRGTLYIIIVQRTVLLFSLI